MGNSNYGTSSYRDGGTIKAIVNHIAAVDATDLFNGFIASGLSSAFYVRHDGKIFQYVDLSRAGYTQGLITIGSDFPAWFVQDALSNDNRLTTSDGVFANLDAIGIEHEGRGVDMGEGYGDLTAAQFNATVALQRWLIDLYKVPLDRDHICGHYRFDHVNRANCPGQGFPWGKLFAALGA